jgi:hypothetical protein
MTDYFANKDGYVADGHVIGFCNCTAAVVEGSWVAWGTTLADYVGVTASAAASDAVGYALKGGAAGDKIPVCFNGVVKTLAGAAFNAGVIVGNQTGANSKKVVTLAYASNLIRLNGVAYTARIIGKALQESSNALDEVLVMVGKL